MKAKFIGFSGDYYHPNGTLLSRGEIMNVDRIFHCIEHYSLWYYKVRGYKHSNADKKSIKHHLPLILCDDVVIGKDSYEIMDE